jgi:hypothetical protein
MLGRRNRCDDTREVRTKMTAVAHVQQKLLVEGLATARIA